MKWAAGFAALLGAASVSVTAATVSLQWEQTENAEVAYYKVYSAGANGMNVVNVAANSAVINVIEGETYSFTVKAVDAEGAESEPSNAVQYTVPLANQPPVIGLLANQIVTVGARVQFPVTVADLDAPKQALTFSLGAGAPEGAEIDPVTGVFTWTPQASTTAEITVVVTDDGYPQASAERVFTMVAGEPGTFFALRIGAFHAGQALHSPRGTLSALGDMYAAGAKVVLNATAAAGYTVMGWMINSQLIASNPVGVTMNKNLAATPVFQKQTGTDDPNQPAEISMQMGLVNGQPAVGIGGELGAWVLEGSGNLKDWIGVANGLTSEQLALDGNTSHAFYRVRSALLTGFVEEPLNLAMDVTMNP